MMNKEKWEGIAKLAGLKLNQKFKIDEYSYTGNIYKIMEDGIFWSDKDVECWNESTLLSIKSLLSSKNIKIITESIKYEDWFPKFGEIYYCVEITDAFECSCNWSKFPRGVKHMQIEHMGKEEKWLREMKKLRLIFPTVKEAEERYKEIIEKIQ